MPPVFNDRCIKCYKCVDICPGDIIRESVKGPVAAYPEECYHCGACMMDCPSGAVKIILPQFIKPVIRRRESN